jgi:hypothetical protein
VFSYTRLIHLALFYPSRLQTGIQANIIHPVEGAIQVKGDESDRLAFV